MLTEAHHKIDHEIDPSSIAKRRLILRDSLAILSLVMVTVVLFAITLFLFRSFSARRAALARSWSDQGRQALQAHQPEEAIKDLHTALSYAPGERQYELLLAQALGEAGRTDESYNYFTSLWEAEPGNGEINLQLARLEAKRAGLDPKERLRQQDRLSAIDFYRAAINGTWTGDGATRRPQVRLELARYLIATHDLTSARLELVIAGGNAPGDSVFYTTVADLLQQADDPTDAWTYYQKATAADPTDSSALQAAGRFAYNSGDFANAHRLLARALEERAKTHASSPDDSADTAMMTDAERILALAPSPTQPARERVARVLAARALARKRLDACTAQFASALPPAALQSLITRWTTPDGAANAAALLQDQSLQESAMQLVYDTEVETDKLCTAPTGDDALLLVLATSPHANALAAASPAQTALPHELTN
jgi:Tfp pilus assembly protein PilF